MGAHPTASLRQRTGEAFEQKHAIARWAVSVILPGVNTIFDAGFTMGALAHELRGFEKAVRDGICEVDDAQTRLKELMPRRGNVVHVLADSSKLGLRPFHAWARLALPWTLVTDDGADPAQVQKFRDAVVPLFGIGGH